MKVTQWRRRGEALFLGATATLLVAAHGSSAVEIDLAVEPDQWIAWGAESRGWLGWDVALGDLNGDGAPDIVLEEARVGSESRVCIEFGPFAIPSERDLLTALPPTCVRIDPSTGNQEVEVADVDGDGLDDLIVATYGDSEPPLLWPLLIYRGRRVWPGVLTPADADWGFAGRETSDHMHWASAGDLNGDGASDLVFFSGDADGPANARGGAGEGYIVFGPAAGWPTRRNLLDDPPDVLIYGADGADQMGLNPGLVADVLGDSTVDLLIQAIGDGPDELRGDAGEIAILPGRATWPAVIDLRDRSATDLVVFGPQPASALRTPAVIDWNGDGVRDLVLGATGYDPGGRRAAGGVFVLLSPLPRGELDLLVRPADATVLGPHAGSGLGFRIVTSDVTGDGYEDLVIDAPGDRTPFGRPNAGAVYTLMGCAGFAPLTDLATDVPDLAIYGVDGGVPGDGLGRGLASRDVDGDGRADFLMGADLADSVLNSRSQAGEVRLVLGQEVKPPVCIARADAGPPQEACAGSRTTLDGSATTVAACLAAPQYRWLFGGDVVRDWSTDPTAMVIVDVDGVYDLEVRCGDCAGPCFDSASVAVTVLPDPIPPDQGNVLRAVRSGFDVELTFPTAPATAWRLYRDPDKFTLGTTPLVPDAATPDFVDAGAIPRPGSDYYQLRGLSPCSFTPGP